MKILIACESSGIVREAFKNRGHDAWSCDLLPSEIYGKHYQGDVYDILFNEYWDLIIAHPECTKLCVSGNHVYAAGKPRHNERLESLKWTVKFWEDCKKTSRRVCFENSVGVLRSQGGLPKPQIIQPYQFGHDASKATCLHLHNLKHLKIDPDLYYEPRVIESGPHAGKKRWSNQTDSGQNRLGPSEDRWKERARTYSGIANAFAEQWG